jgi:hypothetical protein
MALCENFSASKLALLGHVVLALWRYLVRILAEERLFWLNFLVIASAPPRKFLSLLYMP